MATCKLGEKGCWENGKCHYSHDCENKVLTNADSIRAMSDEELGKYLCWLAGCHDCEGRSLCEHPDFKSGDGYTKWLKQPAE